MIPPGPFAKARIFLLAVALAAAGVFPGASPLFGLGRESNSPQDGGAAGPGEYDAVISVLNQAIQRDPGRAENYFARGTAYLLKGDNDKAIANFTTAIRLDPQNAQFYYCRGCAYGTKAENDKSDAQKDLALADFDRALALNPKYAQAYYGRGATYAEKGAYDKSLADYGQAIQFAPDYAEAYNNLAWIMATCPQAHFRDGKKAVEYATKACELTKWQEAASLDTLAAAYAETGDFNSALQWESQCLQTPDITADIATEARTRLALYQDHKPYRESE